MRRKKRGYRLIVIKMQPGIQFSDFVGGLCPLRKTVIFQTFFRYDLGACSLSLTRTPDMVYIVHEGDYEL